MRVSGRKLHELSLHFEAVFLPSLAARLMIVCLSECKDINLIISIDITSLPPLSILHISFSLGHADLKLYQNKFEMNRSLNRLIEFSVAPHEDAV